jgi:hypothetical protein
LSPDPVDRVAGTPDEANPYDYVGNDPVDFEDPTGLCRMVDGDYQFAANAGMCDLARANAASLKGCAMGGATFAEWDPFNHVNWVGNDCTVSVGTDLLYGYWTSRDVGECMAAYWEGHLDGLSTNPMTNPAAAGAAFWTGVATDPQGTFESMLPIWGSVRAIDAAPDLCGRILASGGLAAEMAAIALTAGACRSFSADTDVLMADGTRKPISEVQVGDMVLATDPETGETGPRRVAATMPHTDQLLTLRTSAGEVVTTEDHRYWNATDQQWQESQHLDEGDRLHTADGDTVTVQGLDWTTTHTAPAYDLDITGIDTFYVGAGDDDVLVHNCDVPGNPFRGPGAPQRAFDHLERFHGLDPHVASNRLHTLKHSGGLGAADDVIIGRTGDVYNAQTGDWLGTLTDAALGG